MLPKPFSMMEELRAELCVSRLQGTIKQSVRAARTFLPNGSQVAAVTGKDQAFELPALCRAVC